MSDMKSKLPDLEELGTMTSKLFHGIKNTVTEIVHDYKTKRAQQEAAEKNTETTVTHTPVVPDPVAEEKPVITPVEKPEPVITSPDLEKDKPEADKTIEDKN